MGTDRGNAYLIICDPDGGPKIDLSVSGQGVPRSRGL
jgi:hypothetical protein